jgi:hypothetical protein
MRRNWGPKGRLSKRETIIRNNAVDRFYAMAADKEPQFQVQVPPERAPSKPSGNKLESSVNDEIYDVVKALRNAELWRNNRGVAIYGGHKVRYGVGPNGASDWIGYRRVQITPEMVGSYIAQFVAIEAKAPGKESRDDQRLFLDRVSNDGGCAGVAQSGEDAERILK